LGISCIKENNLHITSSHDILYKRETTHNMLHKPLVTKKRLIFKDLSPTCHGAFFGLSKSKSEREFLMRSLSSKGIKAFV